MAELDNQNVEDTFGPPKTDIVSVGLSILASLVSGFLGGLFILLCTFFFLNAAKLDAGGIFPYVLSLVGLIAILISRYLILFLARAIFPNKYRGDGMAIFAQTFAFSIVLYLFITPLYVYMGHVNVDRIALVFALHILLNGLWVSLISEILSGYRHILVAIYAGFAGFFASTFLSVFLFQSTSESDSTLYALVAVIVMIETTTAIFQRFFELLYYKFFKMTGMDPLSDVFSRIEEEEKRLAKIAEAKLTQFDS